MSLSDEDYKIHLWDVETGKHKQTITGHTSILFTLEGSTVVSGGGYDNTIRLWDVATGKHKKHLMSLVEM